jgi:hypothetical protein
MQPSAIDFALGLEMSDVVNANIDKAIEVTIDKLKELKIECVLRSPQK